MSSDALSSPLIRIDFPRSITSASAGRVSMGRTTVGIDAAGAGDGSAGAPAGRGRVVVSRFHIGDPPSLCHVYVESDRELCSAIHWPLTEPASTTRGDFRRIRRASNPATRTL